MGRWAVTCNDETMDARAYKGRDKQKGKRNDVMSILLIGSDRNITPLNAKDKTTLT